MRPGAAGLCLTCATPLHARRRQKRRAAQDAALEELDNADSGACPPPAGLENFANLAMALSLEAAAPADEPLANWANELQADGFEEELPLTTDLLPPGSPSFLTPYDFSSLSLPAAGSSPARMAGGDAPAQLQAPPQEGNAGAAAARWLHSGSEESPMEEDNPMVFVPVMRPANPVPAAAPPPLPAQVQSEALPAPTLTMHDMQSALTSTIVHQPGVAKRGDGDRAGMQPPFPMPGTGYFGGHTAGRSRLASCSTDVPQGKQDS